LNIVRIIGAGLAGCEAAFQAAEAGARVELYEMRPGRRTAAHKTDAFGELVCSNSLKSEQEHSAPWLLKREMRRLDSLLMRAANATRVPGGQALTVDREQFSAEITRAIEGHPNITVKREEARGVPEGVAIVASGPLTSEPLAEELARITGAARLFFYDSISPIVAMANRSTAATITSTVLLIKSSTTVLSTSC
jgi:methylenetetrahydrofolate--tRNA-(uracil-5-)-methyltransferase